jgi:hypothetical protein
MWQVKWYNYFWKIEVLVLTTKQIMSCLRYDHDYYISVDPIGSKQ